MVIVAPISESELVKGKKLNKVVCIFVFFNMVLFTPIILFQGPPSALNLGATATAVTGDVTTVAGEGTIATTTGIEAVDRGLARRRGGGRDHAIEA